MNTDELSKDETIGDVRLEARAGIPVVSMVGEFDLANAGRLKACFAWLATLPCQQVVIDMSETTFIDSTTLGTLACAHREGLNLVVTGASGEAQRALELCGLYTVLATHR